MNRSQPKTLSPDEIKQGISIRDRYRAEPEKFLVGALGVDPKNIWSGMRKIIESVRDNKKVAIKAGHSVSKTYTMARMVLWFLYCYYPATVITTAPSHDQVEEILWREIRDAHARAKIRLGGNVTKTKIDLGEKWFAYGFATKPDTVTQEATRVQGYHNENMLVVFDEAAGIVRQIWEAAATLLSSGHSKFVAIGNPTSPIGEFIDCFKDPSYHKVTISVKDTPNFIEAREVIIGLSGRTYEEDTRRKFGVESNYYKARVLGQIPDEDPDSLVPLAWIEAAEERDIQTIKTYTKRFVVIDVADGDDEGVKAEKDKSGEHDDTVIMAFENKMHLETVIINNKRIEECEPYAWRLLRKINGNCIIVDGDGIGRVMVKLLNASKGEGVKVINFQGSSKLVTNSIDFETRYSEGHWSMREDFEKNLIGIPKDPEQRQEISLVRLVNHKKGFITIEKKKYLKKRLNRSPGKKDCIMMMSAEYRNVPILHRKSNWEQYKPSRVNEQLSAMAA